MKATELKSMSIDDLWSLREQVDSILSSKISEEMQYLNRRIRQIEPRIFRGHARRPYPPVQPKYQNPRQPSETWAGRGLQPRWLTAQLRSGKKLDDFRIRPS
jgi:DNA-binding protein H-NS